MDGDTLVGILIVYDDCRIEIYPAKKSDIV